MTDLKGTKQCISDVVAQVIFGEVDYYKSHLAVQMKHGLIVKNANGRHELLGWGLIEGALLERSLW